MIGKKNDNKDLEKKVITVGWVDKKISGRFRFRTSMIR